MFTKNNQKRVSLLRYWTTRYVITLCIGLAVIALISAIWIRHSTLNHRLNTVELLAQEIADRFVEISEGRVISRSGIPAFLNDRGRFMDFESDPSIYLVDTIGTTISSNRPLNGRFTRLPIAMLTANENVQKLSFEKGGPTFYMVKTPIESENIAYGWVVIIETEQHLTQVNQEYQLLAIMIIGLGLLGWVAVYVLSRRLSKPIKDVAKAAKQLQEGDYNIDLPDDMKEQEVFELIDSFKEMSNRLQKLETLRTELLAGVTHELKTPVTAISGLLQALNDGIVTGDEAKEFLDMSLKESDKMKKLVEDLLAFNTFAANSVIVNKETHDINKLILDTAHQWEVVKENSRIVLTVKTLSEEKLVSVDPIRVQQIITNLLNNAQNAIEGSGEIELHLTETNESISIDVKDTGSGIPIEEQPYIFERFYRGEHKKYKVRGLGLGLPFSKMIAQSLGGDLTLLESSSNGTTFRVTLPKLI